MPGPKRRRRKKRSRPDFSSGLRLCVYTAVKGYLRRCVCISVKGRRWRCGLAVLLITAVLVPCAADGRAVFWRYTADRYGRPSLSERLDVPAGREPYGYLAEYRGFDGWFIRREDDVVFIAEKPAAGRVPVLCLHKISRERDYSLTPGRFANLLEYINENGWYMVADYQYLDGDFSRVPTGLKPIVMGADDASYGTVIYQTRGSRLHGKVKRFFGGPLADRDSMAAILERHARREDGRINFTFYISFDAVPFRQLDGYRNPGYPYRGIPVVAEKIRYLDENFVLGIHSLSHTYAGTLGAEAFARDVLDAWILIDDYAGGRARTLHTLSYPFGIGELPPDIRAAVSGLSYGGQRLKGAFDLDGRAAAAPGTDFDRFDVSRLGVDNSSWKNLMRTLESLDAAKARREIVWETPVKRLPRSRWALGADKTDGVWILVRG